MTRSILSFVLILGFIMVIVGAFVLKVPGQDLTDSSTYEPKGDLPVNGDGSSRSYIDKYVGGDAYNYIIGANLVGSRITGIIVAKAILISIGLLISSLGGIGFYFSDLLTESNPKAVVPSPETRETTKAPEKPEDPESQEVPIVPYAE